MARLATALAVLAAVLAAGLAVLLTRDGGPVGAAPMPAFPPAASASTAPVTGWQIGLRPPRGGRVGAVEGAGYRPEAQRLVFRPTAGTESIVGGGSVSFTFEVPGLLAVARPTA